MHYLVFLVTAGLVIFLDQTTKFYIKQILSPGDSLPVVKGIFHLSYVRNPGAAFGVLPNSYPFPLLISLVAIGLIILYYRKTQPMGIGQSIGLGLVLGGAVGNLIDRISSGQVIDFLDFKIWPVFNLADSAMVIGLGILVILWIKKR